MIFPSLEECSGAASCAISRFLTFFLLQDSYFGGTIEWRITPSLSYIFPLLFYHILENLDSLRYSRFIPFELINLFFNDLTCRTRVSEREREREREGYY
jgi:hypothetical protein